MFRNRSILIASIACTACVLGPTPVVAQDDVLLEEIVVTATRREEKLQEVPLSVSVMSGEQLRDSVAHQLDDFAGFAPGLTLVKERARGRSDLVVRGMRSIGFGQSTTGLYVDDVSQAFLTNQSDADLFDIERIEVLKGPQGTLFGEGSLGGTVRILTRMPDVDSFESSFDLEGLSVESGDSGYGVYGMVNAPIVEGKSAIRFVAYKRDDPGYIDNILLGQQDVNSYETVGGRLHVLFAPTDATSIRLSAVIQDGSSGGADTVNPAIDGAGEFEQLRNVPETYIQDMHQYSLVVDHDFSSFTLTSITAHHKRDQNASRILKQDLGFGPMNAAHMIDGFPLEIFSQEIRLVSTSEGRFDWVAGAYYRSREDGLQQNAEDVTGFFPPGFLIFSTDGVTKFDQIAGFGEFGYQVTGRVKLQAGLRVFRESFDNTTDQFLFTAGASSVSASDSETVTTPKLTISFEPADGNMIYATASQGFRSGGANGTPGAPLTFKSDSAWNYEIGTKNTLSGGKVILNASLFAIDWTDLQIRELLGPISYTGNAGKAESRGAEIELMARPSDGLDVAIGLGYTDAKITDPKGANFLPGDRIPYVPELTASLRVNYGWQFGSGLDARIGADVAYSGDTTGDFEQPEGESHTRVGLRLGLGGERWDATLFARNLLDERANLRTVDINNSAVLQPRTIGLRFSYRSN